MELESLDNKFALLNHRIVEKINERKAGKIYEEDFLIFGLISRANSLYNGMKKSYTSNPHVFVVLYRAQIETLAAINALIAKPENITNFLHGGRKNSNFKITNIMTLIDKCKKKYPWLREEYDDMSEIVHPNSSSHFLSTKLKFDKKLIINWESRPSFSSKQIEKALKDLLKLNNSILKDLQYIVEYMMK